MYALNSESNDSTMPDVVMTAGVAGGGQANGDAAAVGGTSHTNANEDAAGGNAGGALRNTSAEHAQDGENGGSYFLVEEKLHE